ncbi:COX15/CtaA family protein [Nocardioides humilatus]|uniref:COX15/CtaA family protein n=1 Tax=Nocardioides humilatus TaxID=2607660 RepID=UPI001FE2E6E6|nr:COX15/CtaA family protein [Nocardioides humilatus]
MSTPVPVATQPSVLLVRLGWANLIANIGIVITGAAVRLTGSGLGCPTWPRCTDESYVVHQELGINGAIEFGNRMLTFVLVVIAVACWVAALQQVRSDRAGADRRPLALATVIALGIPAQAVIGGITVRTDLNPWVVSLHLVVSLTIIGVCVALVDHLVGRPRAWATSRSRRAALLTLGLGTVVLYLGTIVTGSGPHSGDLEARRTGLDPATMSHVHAWVVYALVAATVLTLVLARRDGNVPLFVAARTLLAIELLQGAIGFTQYFLDLPVALVLLHMLGAALTAASLAWVVLSTRARRTN